MYTNELGILPYKPPVNLSNIYNSAADTVTSSITVNCKSYSLDIKCLKILDCGIQPISDSNVYASPPLHNIRRVTPQGSVFVRNSYVYSGRGFDVNYVQTMCGD
jgi:hypothetical protein